MEVGSVSTNSIPTEFVWCGSADTVTAAGEFSQRLAGCSNGDKALERSRVTDIHSWFKNIQIHDDSPTGEFFQRLDGCSNGCETPERGRVTGTY